MSSQRLGKYACLEIERRYLLCKLPACLTRQDYSWYITDRYILNTRLRLRQMLSPSTKAAIFKLGQKYRDVSQDPTQATITNIYLNNEEYRCLAKLEANEIVKKQYNYVSQGYRYGINVFEGTLAGLILAEIECETEAEAAHLPLPPFVVKDVTDDPFFTGGYLATMTKKEFQEGLAKRLNKPI